MSSLGRDCSYRPASFFVQSGLILDEKSMRLDDHLFPPSCKTKSAHPGADFGSGMCAFQCRVYNSYCFSSSVYFWRSDAGMLKASMAWIGVQLRYFIRFWISLQNPPPERRGMTDRAYSKCAATSSRYLRIGRCWGHMASHWPHFRQSEALPWSTVRFS